MNLLTEQARDLFNEAVRSGDIRYATCTITRAISARIATVGLPMYSDAIKSTMQQRRQQIAVALKVIAKEIEAAAEELLREDK